jgi:GDP-L-fucose synthase
MASGPLTYVAGHSGLAGAAILRRLQSVGNGEILVRTHAELELRDASAVDRFFAEHRPERVYLAAARVGGIAANERQPAEFIRENLQIQTNVIDAAWRHGAAKLLFLGSSCIYPRNAAQPISEDQLLTGPLEPTNEAYAIAKIAGLKMCQAYRRQYGFDAVCLMPTNLYGPEDKFSSGSSHVVPALIGRMHEAKQRHCREVVVWGSGRPLREFLHADDFAAAACLVMERATQHDIINAGSGEELSISELADVIQSVVGFEGHLRFDESRPDGSPRKLLDCTRLRNLGWAPKLPLREGLMRTYQSFLALQ